ncbi:MAG TPA: hypothetical protein DEP35_13880 [Deltaproteobacteria bacterium]|nr:hypothetical protein [Deltaproteobacteria bacterium]
MISLMSAGDASGWNYLPLLDVERAFALDHTSRSVGTGGIEPPTPTVSINLKAAIHKWAKLMDFAGLRNPSLGAFGGFLERMDPTSDPTPRPPLWPSGSRGSTPASPVASTRTSRGANRISLEPRGDLVAEGPREKEPHRGEGSWVQWENCRSERREEASGV